MGSKIVIIVGNIQFTADLYNSAVSSSFIEQFPLTVNMEHFDSSEYFTPLDKRLNGEGKQAQNIMPGDIALYKEISISIFYNPADEKSDYIKIGHINNPLGLDKALAEYNGRVTFDVA